jgi:hypothetical protein
MVHIIGNANEFWRLRVTRLDTTENLEFEWHSDILYRDPRPDYGDEVESWYVEAVRVDDPDTVSRLAVCPTHGEARDVLAAISGDLAQMTKAQFELAYVDVAEQGDVGVE